MGTFVITFLTSVLYLCYDACCLFKYGALATSDVDAGGPGMPRGMSDYQVNVEMADMVASQTGGPRIRRGPYSRAPGTDPRPVSSAGGGGGGGGYSDEPPPRTGSTHSAPPERQGPTVMVAGMQRSGSVASAASASTTPVGNLLGSGFGRDGDDGSGSCGGSGGSSGEEGEWAASSSPAPAPAPASASGGGPPVDLLS